MNLYSLSCVHVGTVPTDCTNAPLPADGTMPLTFSHFKLHLRSKSWIKKAWQQLTLTLRLGLSIYRHSN